MNERPVLLGVIALSAVNAGKLGLQLLVLPILARILGPESFGLIGLAMPFVLLSNMLCDAGMGAALVRQANPSWELEATVFWLSLIISTSLVALIWILAAPVADIFSQPKIAPVLMALSSILVLSAGLCVPNARIVRSRRFGVFASGDLISSVASAGAGIASALDGWGVWSLVMQQLVLWGTKAAWIIPVSGFRPAFFFQPALTRPFFVFGLNSVASNVFDFVGKNAPSLVVGGVLGVTALGYFSMAFQLTRVPELVISGPVFLTTFIAVSRFAKPEAAHSFVIRTLRMTVMVLAPLFCGLSLTADLATDVLLGPKWAEAAPAFGALAPGEFFLCLYSFVGAVMLGIGSSSRQFWLTLTCGAAMIAGSTAGTPFGILGVAMGLSAGAALLLPFYLLSLSSKLRLPLQTILSAMIAPLAATIAMACVVVAVRAQISSLDKELQLAIAIVSGVCSFGAAILTIGRHQLRRDLKQLWATQGSKA